MPSGTYERTPEIRAKISAAFTPKMRAEISQALMGHNVAPETRAKQSAASRGNTHRRGSHHTQEARAKLSAAQSVQLGSTYRTAQGYVEVKTVNGWAKEHRVVMGLKPGDPRVVHHIDGDKANNERSNLQVFASRGTHSRHHHQQRRERSEPVGISPV